MGFKLEHTTRNNDDLASFLGSLNVKVLLLVRDPRGTLQSRKHREWCPKHPDCDDPKMLCQDLVDDYKAAWSMLRDFPARFRWRILP